MACCFHCFRMGTEATAKTIGMVQVKPWYICSNQGANRRTHETIKHDPNVRISPLRLSGRFLCARVLNYRCLLAGGCSLLQHSEGCTKCHSPGHRERERKRERERERERARRADLHSEYEWKKTFWLIVFPAKVSPWPQLIYAAVTFALYEGQTWLPPSVGIRVSMSGPIVWVPCVTLSL